jgi:hypothetical protein
MATMASLDLAKKYWPIVVAVVAAGWSLYVFVIKDAPLLKTRVDGSINLTWSDTGLADTCRALPSNFP